MEDVQLSANTDIQKQSRSHHAEFHVAGQVLKSAITPLLEQGVSR